MSVHQGGRENRLVRVRRMLLSAALAFAIAAPLLVLLGLLATRLNWVDWRIGLAPIHSVIGQQSVSSFLAAVGAILGVLGLILAVLIPPRRGYIAALVAIALGAITYAGFAQFWVRVRSHPPIHDVATDWKDTLLFSPQLMAARGPDANAVETAPAVPEGPGGRGFMGRPVAEVNAMTCPAATPLTLLLHPAEAYVKAKAEISREGMRVVTDNPAAGVVEGTASDFWSGLKDDLAVRVRAAGAGTRIDLRSTSRYGLNDLGTNCNRITHLRKVLQP